ncbi:hypothetical protein [Sphingomonas sp. G-3-2-10]|uniref:hypothetical protein n=1 Tax=Sphingomonas sp. G-3-2-10 TaxID=2728838 RepID=UPI00146BCE3E|nr:hypothetical protein [Sphingomonas sp. G-3-2-10]NML06528.1 hypothetical protein [Sphingomonas sp. G-3-2-10]
MKLIFISAMIAVCLCTPAQAQTMQLQRIGQWTVAGISRAGGPVCRMERTYPNGTIFNVDVFIQSRTIEISIANRDWQSLNEVPNDSGHTQGSIATSISYSRGSVAWQGRAKIRRSSALNPEPGIYIRGPVGELSPVIEGMHTATILLVKAGEVSVLSASPDGLDSALAALKSQCIAPHYYQPENDPFRR